MSEIAAQDRSFPNLTLLQEAFVLAYVANGGKEVQAAKDAGYAATTAKAAREHLLGNSKICEAINVAMVKQLSIVGPKALGVVVRLSVSAKSEYVRLMAAKDLLDRIGMTAPKRINLGGSLSVSFDLG